jgi:hypothetical protein
MGDKWKVLGRWTRRCDGTRGDKSIRIFYRCYYEYGEDAHQMVCCKKHLFILIVLLLCFVVVLSLVERCDGWWLDIDSSRRSI